MCAIWRRDAAAVVLFLPELWNHQNTQNGVWNGSIKVVKELQCQQHGLELGITDRKPGTSGADLRTFGPCSLAELAMRATDELESLLSQPNDFY